MESALNVQSTLKPGQVSVLMIEHAVIKHATRYDKIFFKAFLAGLMLSFGGLMNVLVNAGSTDLNASNPALVKILGGFVFPSGFVLIVMLGLELLTSNMMVFPMAVVTRAIPWWSLVVNWTIVTFGNLAGSLFSAAILVHYSGIVSTEPFLSGVVAYAEKKAVIPEWHQIFLRGIGCNILVCLAVWLAAGAKETVSKLIAIWIPIWNAASLTLFPTVIANMFYIPLGIMFGTDLTVAGYIRKSLIATYLGNIVGAAIVWLPRRILLPRRLLASGASAERGRRADHGCKA
ncbi:putative formate/nitrite transporter [Mycena sanguinolenta]|uniref:Putative formate/nitrite transporter n=1 Tax=Mycena sanguinolenta TaxID=230812 RepID=A0A8H6YIR1_9AGAR|nr:putative formate/nitrite transporter [Mycena sanguinolenta]